MKGLAKDQRDAASLELEKLSVRLERIDAVNTRLAQTQIDLVAANDRQQLLEKSAAAIGSLDESEKEAAAATETIARRLEVLDEHAGRLPDEAATAHAIAEASSAETRRTDLATALEEAQRALQQAEKDLHTANEDGEPQLLERAAGLLAAAEPQLKAVVDADRRIAAAEGLVTKAKEAVAVAEERLHSAEQVRDGSLGRAAEAAKILEDAAAALELGRHADMAATLRSSLHSEEPCPVCDQMVYELPEELGETHLDELERVLAAAKRTKADVDETHTAALSALEGTREQTQAAIARVSAAEDQLRGTRKDSAAARADLEETTMRLEKILGAGDPAEHLDRRRADYERLSVDRDNAQRRADQVRGQHDQAIRDEQESGKVLQDLGMRLADLAARLGVEQEIGDDAGSLGRSLHQLRDSWSQVTRELRDEHAEAEKVLVAVAAERSELLHGLGVTGDIAAAIAVGADRIDRLEKSVQADRAELEQSEELIAARDASEHRVQLFGRINTDLTDSRFIRFLLDDERARLAELGSEHFQRLSAGRYRFANDQFAIVDLTAADGVRRADSLSGGETFLASLGLALALAEMVAGTGGRLDAFFLDEGFGTLDPEHLDLAMEGIEMLVADQSSRLVVIVSHVPELRDRIEDLIMLERDPVSGNTKAVAGAGTNPSRVEA
jgi:exonuclease SbcC